MSGGYVLEPSYRLVVQHMDSFSIHAALAHFLRHKIVDLRNIIPLYVFTIFLFKPGVLNLNVHVKPN